MHIRGPIEPMLATAVDHIPTPQECRGGARYEIKADGYRTIIRTDEYRSVQLFSRRGKRLNDLFPELVMAAFEVLPPCTVIDGEIVRWSSTGAFDFAALGRRTTAGRRVRDLARVEPTHVLAFDLLELNAVDVRPRPLSQRRAMLETLLGDLPPTALIVPILQTELAATARLWLDTLPAVGIEGLVVKAAADFLPPGQARLAQDQASRHH